jgi:asparagine synthase (glutamine-hydrolysing)
MCGIAGIVAQFPVRPAAVKEMIDRMAHRGPDGDGVWQSPDNLIVLGHRRLAILDPTERGRQPMADPTGRVIVTFNGEIYNYLELAARLREEGVEFETGTDTEVLLQAYLHWGDNFVRELNGMFSFCLYDRKRDRVLCARDRFAEKPFLFTQGEGFFAFASEYKALLALDGVSSDFTADRILRFLETGRFGLDDGRETAFPAIEQLRGGEMLILESGHRIPRISRYWQIKRDTGLAKMNDRDAIDMFRDLLFDSVKIRMRSDVELGSCLSGGLDSSAIVCIARQLIGPDKDYHVFSGRFPGTSADEGDFADIVATETKATMHVAVPDPDDLIQRLESFVWFNELPVSSTSQFAQWRVFETAKKNGVTVLLDGQGADELLGGYEQYFRYYLQAIETTGGKSLTAKEKGAIKKRYPLALPSADQHLKTLLPKSVRRMAAQYLGRGSDFSFGLSTIHPVTPDPRPQDIDIGADALSGMLEEDSFHAHLPALLRYGDRNSMAHSREVRLPFCDHRIAEFVLSLSPQHLMGEAQTKRILRKSMEGIVPPQVLGRWNKQGFLPPQGQWFGQGLGQAFDQMLASESFQSRGWWNVGWWQKAYSRFKQGEAHLAWTLWKPLIAEAWCEHFVDRLNGMPRISINANSGNK